MSLILEVKVVPSSGRQECIIDKAGKLKCYLKNPPERGLANNELVKFFAKKLNIAQQKIVLIAGQASRNKKIKIESNLTFAQVIALLGIEQQKSLFE